MITYALSVSRSKFAARVLLVAGLLTLFITVGSVIGTPAAMAAPVNEVTSVEVSSQLTEAEIEGLLYMREEEKADPSI